MNKADTAAALKDDSLFVSTVLGILVKEYGTACLNWESETFAWALKSDFGVEASTPLMDKIRAGSMIMTNDSVLTDIVVFSTVCNTMNMGVVLADVWLPADLDDVAWGLTEMEKLIPEEMPRLSSDVRKMIGVLLAQEGIFVPPPSLKQAIYQNSAVNYSNDGLENSELGLAFWQQHDDYKKGLEQEVDRKEKLLQLQLQKFGLIPA